MAAPLTFGAGKGCDFFKSCRSDGGNNYWCDMRSKGVACTWDLKVITISSRKRIWIQRTSWLMRRPHLQSNHPSVCYQGIGICDVDDLMNNCATPKPISGHSCFQEGLGLPDHVWGNSKGPSARCLQEVSRCSRALLSVIWETSILLLVHLLPCLYVL